MGSIANVVAGKPVTAGGGVNFANVGAILPTDASGALAGFTRGGFISEDGLTEATERSTEKVKAWGGDTVKVLQTEFAATFTLTFLESINGDVLKVIAGDENVTITPATAAAGKKIAVKVKSDQLPRKSWVFDVRDGDARVRICVPLGQVTEVGEVTYNDGSVIGYQVTIETFYDSILGGYYVKYLDDGQPVDEDSSSSSSSSSSAG